MREQAIWIRTTVFLIFLFAPYILWSQQTGLTHELSTIIEAPRDVRLLFYNCENLFDTENDTLKQDEEFLPEGARYWTKTKYFDKLNNINKVITAVGGWSPPELVGLCEIENKHVLHDLTRNTPLYLSEYEIIHNESPDLRGIDVALLYQPEKFHPIKSQFITVELDTGYRPTREILYSKGLVNNNDTLHVFVNHWPSRYGGQMESEEKRIMAAQTLLRIVDSIQANTLFPKIVILGDFNDEPHNKSISKVLKAKSVNNVVDSLTLYNLATNPVTTKVGGTHKYHGNWGTLDQIIVNGNLLNKNSSINVNKPAMTVFDAGFLLEDDENYLGTKPFRTFIGFRYNEGFSDHLPVFIDLDFNN